MLKRINWKLIFKCFAWIVCLSGLVVLMSFVSIKKQTVTCTKVTILIPGANNFIEREEVDEILKHSQGILIGRKLEQINLHDIEKNLQANPYIAFSKVYADMDGVIHIEVKQRQPILRVINSNDQDFYIDSEGLKMPVSPNFTANILVANGKIMEHFTGKVDTLITSLAKDLYKTALFIKKDTLWDAQIEQLFINDKNDIELVPRVGNQRIVLGSADSLEVKMRNLLAFYKQAMPKVGWDTYKTINIKYTNQVVCEKNKIDSLNGKARKTTIVSESLPKTSAVDSLEGFDLANEGFDEPEPVKKTAKPQVAPVKKSSENAPVKGSDKTGESIKKDTRKTNNNKLNKSI